MLAWDGEPVPGIDVERLAMEMTMGTEMSFVTRTARQMIKKYRDGGRTV